VREANTGKIAITMDKAQYDVTSMAWGIDNTRLAMMTVDELTLIWDSQQNKIETIFPVGIDRNEDFHGFYTMRNGVAWSPDGTKLAGVGSGKSVYIWDAQTYELIHEIEWEGE